MGIVALVRQGVNRDRLEELALGLSLPQALIVWEYSDFFGRVLLRCEFFSSSYLYVGWEAAQKTRLIFFRVGSGLWSRQGSRDMFKRCSFFGYNNNYGFIFYWNNQASRTVIQNQIHVILRVIMVLMFCIWALMMAVIVLHWKQSMG